MRAWTPMLAMGVLTLAGAAEPEVGPFFEPEQPFFQSQVDVAPPRPGEPLAQNFVVRGILIRVGVAHGVVFDQELLRMAAIWEVPEGQPLVTLKTMSQISYADPRQKAGVEHPQPTGPLRLTTPMHPGVAADEAELLHDPRLAGEHADAGRGPLPVSVGRFEGVELRGETAVLRYRSGDTPIREWYNSETAGAGTVLWRNFEIGPRERPLHIALGRVDDATWSVTSRMARAQRADGVALTIGANSDTVTFSERAGELVATVAGADETRRFGIAMMPGDATIAGAETFATELPAASKRLRWAGSVEAPAQLEALAQNGLILDRIATPEENPWRRRVRAADLGFVSDDRAAVVTYDGDVWLVDGLGDPALARISWRRFASGLHEPLALVVAPGGIIQVATKNGVVRLHDRDGNGEADWFENFSDGVIQSQTTRSFPLDMALGPDGSTYVSQGGIVTRSGMAAGGEGTAHTGGIVRISPDGGSAELFGGAMREPFLTVNPKTGDVTATDQQGHFIPSSVVYLVRAGDRFGFPERNPVKLTPPLVWLPHDQDTSSSSQVWLKGEAFGPWDGRLLHLSYGTGRMFVVTPDLAAPTSQGAAIPLDLKTDLPLLHARMNRQADAVFLAGFQIWGTRTGTKWALGRLRRGTTPMVTALAARSVAGGVVLEFATPVKAESLQPERVQVRAWNYRRSAAYGSGRYTLAGPAGTTPLGVAQVVAGRGGRAVFVHVPELAVAGQVEVRHEFELADGSVARGVVYFTIHQPAPADLLALGFPEIDLSRQAAVIALEAEPPATPARGRALAERLGCLACHSTDGSTEAKTGPTWRNLFGSMRRFVDGTSEFADEQYLREKILDPQQKRMKEGTVEMPSYRGVLTEPQLDALVMYIRSIGHRFD